MAIRTEERFFMRHVWVVVAGLFMIQAGGYAQDLAELTVDHALTTEFETPHTVWARPYVSGTTRVLFVTNGRGTLPRECVELLERFDFQAEAVFWTRIVDSSKEHWHGGDVGERRMLGLLEQPWDCIVLLEQGIDKMSAEQQFKLLSPVVAGSGLVMVGRRDSRVFKEANRIADPPAFLRRGGDVEAYTVGHGRGVVLPRRPDIGYHEGWETEYDYWAERFGRAILWAAGKEPPVSVALSVEKDPLPWGRWESQLHLKIGSAENDKERFKLRVRLRRAIGDAEYMPTRTVGSGEEVLLRLPPLAADRWYADAWLLRGDKVVAWSGLSFGVAVPRKVSKVDLAQSWSEIGGDLAGKIHLEGPEVAGESLVVRLLDPRRRVLARQVFPGGGTTVDFRFPVQAWYPMLVTVDARIMAAGREVHGAYAYANVTQRGRGRFNFLIWDTPHGTLAPYAEQNLARHGVTLQLGHGNPPRIVAANNISWVPYTTRIMAKLGPDQIMKPFCWNDEAAVEAHVREKARELLPARHHGVFVWSLGDEVDTQGCCASPHCAEAYRRFLQGQYGTVGALNASWGTDFKAWSEVGIADPADLNEAAALRAGNYPRWFDRQAFKSWNFVHFCSRYKAAYEAIDPEAKVGFEGAGRFDRGDNIESIVRSNTFWSPYPGTADEVIRSIAPRDFPRANWMGYTKDADTLLAKYWRMVTLGMDAVWWWRWDCIGRFHGWLAPDLRPFPAVKDILADTRIVREGLGDLLLRCTMEDDRIAVLYSYPSSLIHKMRHGATFGGYEGAHLGAHTLVRSLGLQFRYITDRSLREDGLSPTRYRVLILPRAEALGEREAAAIRAFVEAGGLVIADCRTGIYDAHCKARDTGILDDLFGIQRKGVPEATIVKDKEWGSLAVDPGVEVPAGTPVQRVSGMPIFVRKTTGKGETLYLNFDLSSLPKFNLPNAPEDLALDIALILAGHGVIPEYTILRRNGKPEYNVAVTRWRNGSGALFSLFRIGSEANRVRVLLPAKRAVYDLKRQRYLGRVKRFQTEIVPNRASFFAVLPEKSPNALVRVNEKMVKPGSVVQVHLEVPGASGLHAFRVRVYSGGTHLEWFDRNVLAGKTPVSFPLGVAYNDPAGEYRVHLVDVVSGKTTVASFTVK